MSEQSSRYLPWLDRLAGLVPNYRGYLTPAGRRATAHALGAAIAGRLVHSRDWIESALSECELREATTECASLRRIERHLDAILDRLQATDSGLAEFEHAPTLSPEAADALHATDLALYERAGAILEHLHAPDRDHDRLPKFEADLVAFERALDERAGRLRSAT